MYAVEFGGSAGVSSYVEDYYINEHCTFNSISELLLSKDKVHKKCTLHHKATKR